MKARMKQLESLNTSVVSYGLGGFSAAKQFTQWSKDHQLEYNALFEVVVRKARHPKVDENDPQFEGIKYTEEEMETQRKELAYDYDLKAQE